MAALLALVASLAACGGGSAAVPANAVAVVGGTPLTTAEFNNFFAQAVAQAKATTGVAPTAGSPQYAQMRSQVVAYLVQVHELEQQAPKEGVVVTQKDVAQFLTNLAKTKFNGSMSKLAAALKTQGLTMSAARQEVYINLVAQKIHTKVTADATVSPAEEHAYYTANLSQFTTAASETRSVEHILVKSKSLADRLYQQLQHGASFAALAKKYSKDPSSAAQGGKYTATKHEVPAYDAVAFTLKTGQLSAPVDATSAADNHYGWFIIRALGPVQATKAHTTTFVQAEPSIKSTLLTQKQNALWQQWLADMAKEYQGKVSYQTGYAPPTTTAIATLPTPTTG